MTCNFIIYLFYVFVDVDIICEIYRICRSFVKHLFSVIVCTCTTSGKGDSGVSNGDWGRPLVP